MIYIIPTISTTDGKQYFMHVCDCGRQTTAGLCDHVSEPTYFEKQFQQAAPYHGVMYQTR
jgi:hypothetical protein